MNQDLLDKSDLEILFPEEINHKRSKKHIQPKKKRILNPYLKFVGLFVGIFIISYVIVNINAISRNFSYFWDVNLRHQSYNQAVSTPQPTLALDPSSPAKLVVPKIGVEVPIVWNVDEDGIQDALLNGVAHSKGTAIPGQKGNIFITGHSSYYSWSSSPYKDIFALLEKLSPGDKIYIQYQGVTFTYEVRNSKVVSPKEVSVMDPTQDNILTLMTCVPIGTNLNRLIVTSTQIPS